MKKSISLLIAASLAATAMPVAADDGSPRFDHCRKGDHWTQRWSLCWWFTIIGNGKP